MGAGKETSNNDEFNCNKESSSYSEEHKYSEKSQPKFEEYGHIIKNKSKEKKGIEEKKGKEI